MAEDVAGFDHGSNTDAEERVKSIFENMIAASLDLETDELTLDREKAISYYLGDLDDDVEVETDRSSVVSRDVADTIGWILPQMMRVFMGSDDIANFEAPRAAAISAAKEASDYINTKFSNEWEGYERLYEVFHDAFLVRNGILKVYWDDAETTDIEEYRSISIQALQALVDEAPDEYEVLEGPDQVDPEMVTMQDPQTGAPMEMEEPRFRVKLERTRNAGRVRLECVPLEDFLIDPAAYSFNDARFFGQRMRKTRTSLIEAGLDPGKIDDLPAWSVSEFSEEKQERRRGLYYGQGSSEDASGESMDKSAEFVEIFEGYLMVDIDDDGRAEWVKAILGGRAGNGEILAMEIWDDDVPFVDFVPDPMPHRWLGRSIAEQTMDIQRIKTVIWRQMLDNIYFHNHPLPIVYAAAFESDDLARLSAFLGPVETNQPPGQSISWYQVPPVIDQALQAMAYADEVLERRTGVSKTAMGLDMDALQNQTATAVAGNLNNSYGKIELYARNLAEGGMKSLFQKIYRLVRRNVTSETEYSRGGGQFATVDPSVWPRAMDVVVNTGLGAGSRDKDIQALSLLGNFQQNVVQTYGPDNPVVTVTHVRALGEKMAMTLGIKSVDPFMAPEQQVQQALEMQAQQPPAPDPEVQKAQAKAQADAQKQQAELALKQQEQQADTRLDVQKQQTQLQISREKAQQDVALQRERFQDEVRLKREQIMGELAIKRWQIGQELELQRMLPQPGMYGHRATVTPGGDAG